ncbi:hypothetical protein ACJX0J_035294, partial [Zea mays]
CIVNGVHVVAGMSQKKMKGKIAVWREKTIIVIFSWVQTFFLHENLETIVIYMNMLCMLWSLSLRFLCFLIFFLTDQIIYFILSLVSKYFIFLRYVFILKRSDYIG